MATEVLAPMAETRTLSIKLVADVVEAARIVAAYRGEPMTEMLSDILRPILVKMEAQEVARRAKRGEKGGPS